MGNETLYGITLEEFIYFWILLFGVLVAGVIAFFVIIYGLKALLNFIKP